MKLSPLKYRDYEWPHNPTLYNIKYVKDIVQHRYPYINGAELEDLGMDARVFSGSGAFFGPDAYQQFGKLATVFYEKGPGKLIHPIWMPTDAIFSRLELKQEPTPNYVEYEFEFIEHKVITVIQEIKSGNTNSGSNSNTQPAKKETTHIVSQGETLSGIGAKYGVPWRSIADANSALIKDPNKIQIGWKLIIPNPTQTPTTGKSSTPTPAPSKSTQRANDAPKNVGGIQEISNSIHPSKIN